MWKISTVSLRDILHFKCSRRYTKEVVLLVNSDCALRKTCAVGVFQKVTYISGLNLI